jgi:glycosyltransferase involved in cell wall biosynthesis
MNNRILISHPTGNANVRAALSALLEAGGLKEFHTTVASYPGNVWDLLGRSRLGKEFNRRKYDQRLQPLTVQHPYRELGRIAAGRLKLPRLIRYETGPFCMDEIYRRLDHAVARRLRKSPRSFSGVYVYEDGAVESLKAAKENGLTGIYELPIGYWRASLKFLDPEPGRVPEWGSTLTCVRDSIKKLNRKDEELANASKIIVASSFTANTLKDYPGKLPAPVVIPYGFPPVCPEPPPASRGPVTKENPLRLIFVGMLSQRKGIADLFAAVNSLGKFVSLTVVGAKVVRSCPALDRELARHRWIPSLPHNRILEEMRAHEVFVFPSLFEGFGLVITEAMSQGVPVITTERTAGPDLIRHEDNGWLIQAASTGALTEQLEKLVRNPKVVQEVGARARKTATARPWSVYKQELAAVMVNNS